MKKVEQNDRTEGSKTAGENKKASSRSLRRKAKRDPENAPHKEGFRGYSK